ncbi:response regulator transcription factor [Peribacillus cavernae]|uniref:Response regulator transcription factor n=1 Tax=Peribacillus cavernae TaxID=1674310 RepID=A0A433HUN1_9BACI|nr:response regulator transcription factor [Peribacillus cavernae]MDQ0219993.1 DNA-binding response OmpR family regulator [Peribacillus cavernae]RUQ32058.1 response regulator transcription factor [Peribacillus cavernae]
MKTLLLVDDEPRMLDLLSLYLIPFYHCIQASSGKEAILKIEDESIDLVLLDVMMPEMDGWSTCEEIRKYSEVPIIMLSARNEKVDIIKGLRIGADDYITKPFDEGELLARIDAVFRRYQNKDLSQIDYHGLIWDEESYELKYEGRKVQTTPKEFLLIGLLLKNPNKVFSRAHLLETIWGNKTFTEDRTVDSHIRNIRDKLRKVDFPIDRHLMTVWGVGYKWVSKE